MSTTKQFNEGGGKDEAMDRSLGMLRESEAKYRTLVENIPQKIFTKDRSSVYVSCNENFARDLGITPEEFKGKNDYVFFPNELADKYRADDTRIMESGKTEAIEEQYMEGGKSRWVHTIKTPLRDEQGNIVGILGIFSDITERKC
jgi:PAS domain S-box-containing protein